jgi:N-acyl homoserine lactone hydrolase
MGGQLPRTDDIRRVDFGSFVRPGEETETGRPRVESLLGYVVALPQGGFLLFDTGMGSHPDVDRHYRPTRRPLVQALRDAGVTVDEVRLVANCHLHVDHCGGNPDLAGRPMFVQSVELDTARMEPDYTLPELVDFSGVRYERVDGEAALAPGIVVMPTPGHTAGHQSLIVRCGDGTVVLAGQPPAAPGWMERILTLDPARVLFAHDPAAWEPVG